MKSRRINEIQIKLTFLVILRLSSCMHVLFPEKACCSRAWARESGDKVEKEKERKKCKEAPLKINILICRSQTYKGPN